MTKLSNEANDPLEVEPINKQRLDFIASSLNEKLNLVQTFDEEIIENCAVDEIETEILESDEINSRVMDLLRLINEATTPKDSNAGISTVPTTINVSEITSSGTYPNENAPSGFHRLHLLVQVELQLWPLKMLTYNYRGAQLMVEFNLLTLL